MQIMVPEWMKTNDSYAPAKGGSTFAIKTINALCGVMSRLRVQRGHEKKFAMPAGVKLALLVVAILLLSVSQNRLVMLLAAAVINGYLCTWQAEDILNILKGALMASLLAFLVLIPAMIINPSGISNNLSLVAKVFLSLEMVNIFNHTTQWNHITGALKKLHIPSVFIFTLDITLKFIALLGTFTGELLTSLRIRSVGRNDKRYNSVGGVMGVTFIRGVEMSGEMYEAMRCRGFTDDYKGL
jgi:cobalt/nickel transport system permease protein